MSQFPGPVSGPASAPAAGPAAGPTAMPAEQTAGSDPASPHPASPQMAEPVGESGVVRAASWAVGLLLGVVFGMLGTVVNQATFSFFGLFDFPIGLVLAVAAVAFLLVGLRLVLPSRLIAFLAAFGVVGIVAVLTLPSPGGSVLVPANTAGYVWTFAPTVIALIVIAWPKASRRRA